MNLASLAIENSFKSSDRNFPVTGSADLPHRRRKLLVESEGTFGLAASFERLWSRSRDPANRKSRNQVAHNF